MATDKGYSATVWNATAAPNMQLSYDPAVAFITVCWKCGQQLNAGVTHTCPQKPRTIEDRLEALEAATDRIEALLDRLVARYLPE